MTRNGVSRCSKRREYGKGVDMPTDCTFMYPREVCSVLGVAPNTLHSLRARGKVRLAPKEHWYDDKRVTYDRASVEAYLAGRVHHNPAVVTLHEAELLPPEGGSMVWTWNEPNDVDWIGEYGTGMEAWAQYMSANYSWRWATELDGHILNQTDGRPFAWREHDADTWTYGILWVEGE